MHTTKLALSAAAAVVLFAGCGGGGGDTAHPTGTITIGDQTTEIDGYLPVEEAPTRYELRDYIVPDVGRNLKITRSLYTGDDAYNEMHFFTGPVTVGTSNDYYVSTRQDLVKDDFYNEHPVYWTGSLYSVKTEPRAFDEGFDILFADHTIVGDTMHNGKTLNGEAKPRELWFPYIGTVGSIVASDRWNYPDGTYEETDCTLKELSGLANDLPPDDGLLVVCEQRRYPDRAAHDAGAAPIYGLEVRYTFVKGFGCYGVAASESVLGSDGGWRFTNYFFSTEPLH